MGTISLTPKMLSNESFENFGHFIIIYRFITRKVLFIRLSVNTCDSILAKIQPKEKVFFKVFHVVKTP